MIHMHTSLPSSSLYWSWQICNAYYCCSLANMHKPLLILTHLMLTLVYEAHVQPWENWFYPWQEPTFPTMLLFQNVSICQGHPLVLRHDYELNFPHKWRQVSWCSRASCPGKLPVASNPQLRTLLLQAFHGCCWHLAPILNMKFTSQQKSSVIV